MLDRVNSLMACTLLSLATAARADAPARVLADPRATLRISATQTGTVEPAPWLKPGQRVEAGAVLGWFVPRLPTPARNEVEAEQAVARRDAVIGQVQVERFKIEQAPQFEQKLPTPTLQVLTEYRSALGRSQAYSTALAERLPLTAPRAGRLLRAPATAGRLMAAGDSLFELDVPEAVVIAVDASDEGLDPAEARVATRADGQHVELRFLGSGFDAEAGLRRAWYVPIEPVALAINERLRLIQPRGDSAIRVPASAVWREQGDSLVWVHASAERFEARRVEIAAREDDGRVRLASGLADGERIAVTGLSAFATSEHVR